MLLISCQVTVGSVIEGSNNSCTFSVEYDSALFCLSWVQAATLFEDRRFLSATGNEEISFSPTDMLRSVFPLYFVMRHISAAYEYRYVTCNLEQWRHFSYGTSVGSILQHM